MARPPPTEPLTQRRTNEILGLLEGGADIAVRWRLRQGHNPTNWVGNVVDVSETCATIEWRSGAGLPRLSKGVVGRRTFFPNSKIEYLAVKIQVGDDVYVFRGDDMNDTPTVLPNGYVESRPGTPSAASVAPEGEADDYDDDSDEAPPTAQDATVERIVDLERVVTELRNALRDSTKIAERAVAEAADAKMQLAALRREMDRQAAVPSVSPGVSFEEVVALLAEWQPRTPRAAVAADRPLAGLSPFRTRAFRDFDIADTRTWQVDDYEPIVDGIRKDFLKHSLGSSYVDQIRELCKQLHDFLNTAATFGGVSSNDAAATKANRLLWALQATRSHHAGEHDFSLAMSKFDALNADVLQRADRTFSALFASEVAAVPRPAARGRGAPPPRERGSSGRGRGAQQHQQPQPTASTSQVPIQGGVTAARRE